MALPSESVNYIPVLFYWFYTIKKRKKHIVWDFNFTQIIFDIFLRKKCILTLHAGQKNEIHLVFHEFIIWHWPMIYPCSEFWLFILIYLCPSNPDQYFRGFLKFLTGVCNFDLNLYMVTDLWHTHLLNFCLCVDLNLQIIPMSFNFILGLWRTIYVHN